MEVVTMMVVEVQVRMIARGGIHINRRLGQSYSLAQEPPNSRKKNSIIYRLLILAILLNKTTFSPLNIISPLKQEENAHKKFTSLKSHNTN